ncbi:hypothetical protein MMC12_008097 [Toensbergia leucococca]|nr:hypothetical protein [Toensbergia leucococca]
MTASWWNAVRTLLLSRKGMNGVYTAFCYGWMKASVSVENHVAFKYDIPRASWDRPPGAEDKHVRGIIYEYVCGGTLADVQLTPQIVKNVRAGLRGLHTASIAHGDI